MKEKCENRNLGKFKILKNSCFQFVKSHVFLSVIQKWDFKKPTRKNVFYMYVKTATTKSSIKPEQKIKNYKNSVF